MITSRTYHVTHLIDGHVHGHDVAGCGAMYCDGDTRYLGKLEVWGGKLPDDLLVGDRLRCEYDDSEDPRGELVAARIVGSSRTVAPEFAWRPSDRGKS